MVVISTRTSLGEERLSDCLAIRTTARQRSFLEKLSYERKLSMGESVRLLINEAMARAGAI
jgi:hypothetical protein